MKAKALIPLLLFLVLVGFLAKGLMLNPRDLPSALINKPVPSFELPRLDNINNSFTPQQMQSQVWLLNVWASWCVGCRQEHDALVQISKLNLVPLIGLNYKEVRGDDLLAAKKMSFDKETETAIKKANHWLVNEGDPYEFSILDVDGKAGIELGVYGVPETFLIDKNGNIRYKHLGPIDTNSFNNVLLPKIHELLNAK